MYDRTWTYACPSSESRARVAVTDGAVWVVNQCKVTPEQCLSDSEAGTRGKMDSCGIAAIVVLCRQLCRDAELGIFCVISPFCDTSEPQTGKITRKILSSVDDAALINCPISPKVLSLDHMVKYGKNTEHLQRLPPESDCIILGFGKFGVNSRFFAINIGENLGLTQEIPGRPWHDY